MLSQTGTRKLFPQYDVKMMISQSPFLPSFTVHLTCRMALICLSIALHTGHLLSDQPPHRHSDGGKSGKGADGKYCLWDRTLYQEYRLQQGQKVIFLIALVIPTDSFASAFTLLHLFSITD